MEFIVKIVLVIAAVVAFWYLVKGMVWVVDTLSDPIAFDKNVPPPPTDKEKSHD